MKEISVRWRVGWVGLDSVTREKASILANNYDVV